MTGKEQKEKIGDEGGNEKEKAMGEREKLKEGEG